LALALDAHVLRELRALHRVARILAVPLHRARRDRLAHLPRRARRIARGVRHAVAVRVLVPVLAVALHLLLDVEAVEPGLAGELAAAAVRIAAAVHTGRPRRAERVVVDDGVAVVVLAVARLRRRPDRALAERHAVLADRLP